MTKFKTYSGGVFAGDSFEYYLTDSSKFNLKVAEVNYDDQRVEFICKENKIFKYELLGRVVENDSTIITVIEDTLKVEQYLIEELGNFE